MQRLNILGLLKAGHSFPLFIASSCRSCVAVLCGLDAAQRIHPELWAAIYGEDGQAIASREITGGEIDRSDSWKTCLVP
jgi:hypothetical protein